MAELLRYIDPQAERNQDLDFSRLKKEGINLIEQYSGDIWTDYNEHDPGITILEQLIFALTELAYRTDFEVKDLLTDNKTGKINEQEQALFSADEIMPCNALTGKDYSKLLYDNIYGLANAWFSTIPTDKYGVNGLFKISVFVYDLPKYETRSARQKIRTDITKLLSAHRNLCEDFEEIELLEYVDFYIEADIEITSKNIPEKVLAEIFMRVSNFVAPPVQLYSYLELRDEGVSIDELLTGPAMKHGFIKEKDLRERPLKVYDTQIIDIINKIEGVKSIKNLKLSLNGVQFTKQIVIKEHQILRYKFKITSKESEKKFGFYKGKNSRKLELNPQRTMQELDNLEASQRRVYKLDEQFKNYLDLPAGRKLKLDDYYSIQNQFPHIYGINHFGIPSSESPLRKAQAKQLKAYLMVFEQILANFLAQLNHFKDLFSIREDLQSTYFYRVLDKDLIPHVKGLYKSDFGELTDGDVPVELEDKVRKLVDRFDHKLLRRSKFLDYLLSLYGERFNQYSLSRFNYYYTADENKKNIIKNKIRFLKDINTINRKRGTGYDYLKPYKIDGNVSGVEFKVKMLLDISSKAASFDGCSVQSIFDNRGLRLVSSSQAVKHDCYEFDEKGRVVSAPVDDATVNYFFEGVWFEETPELGNEEAETLISDTVFIQHGVIDEAMLRAAINRKNYKIGKIIGPDNYIIVLRIPEGNKKIWKRVGTYPDYETTKKAVYALIELARQLNIESEDFHIVEHILLRRQTNGEQPVEQENDFYSFRLTVVLPNWTARFNDLRFQELAMETFYLNIPAHIAVDYLWLGPEEMCDFENSYIEWATMRANENSEQEEVDELAEEIEDFLKTFNAQNKKP